MKPLRLLAATCAASLPLWPIGAGAGTDPDQELTARHTNVIDGVTCIIDIAARRFDDLAVPSTDVLSADPRCRVNSLVSGRFSDEATGDERVASASGTSQFLSLQVHQVSKIRSTTHDLLWTWNNSSTVYELHAPK
jgi:hypothetical protein